MTTIDFQVLQQNSYCTRIHLVPSAVSESEGELTIHDHTWISAANHDGSVRMYNVSTGHFIDVGQQDIVAVDPDSRAPRDGLTYLRVALRRRLHLSGPRAWWH
ncbi:MAG: hypothetical protein JF606_23780 [Burkholderiales bacterium]|jgi:hypothetical protein|nr:hypothetical protein [Burkholderiales bacterium]